MLPGYYESRFTGTRDKGKGMNSAGKETFEAFLKMKPGLFKSGRAKENFFFNMLPLEQIVVFCKGRQIFEVYKMYVIIYDFLGFVFLSFSQSQPGKLRTKKIIIISLPAVSITINQESNKVRELPKYYNLNFIVDRYFTRISSFLSEDSRWPRFVGKTMYKFINC